MGNGIPCTSRLHALLPADDAPLELLAYLDRDGTGSLTITPAGIVRRDFDFTISGTRVQLEAIVSGLRNALDEAHAALELGDRDEGEGIVTLCDASSTPIGEHATHAHAVIK